MMNKDIKVKPKQEKTKKKTRKTIDIDHFIYGSREGYTLLGCSSGVDEDACTDPFEGMLLPITVMEMKRVKDVQSIIPTGANILISRYYQGQKDDKGRPTLANHTAVIPREILENGSANYDDIVKAMVKFETKNFDVVGELSKLKVPLLKNRIKISKIKKLISEKTVEDLIMHYQRKPNVRVFLYFPGSNDESRIQTAYLLSYLLDIKHRLVPIKAFTSVPYAGAKKVFNLVISRDQIDVKPGKGWVMLTIDKYSHGTGGTTIKGLQKDLRRIYKR